MTIEINQNNIKIIASFFEKGWVSFFCPKENDKKAAIVKLQIDKTDLDDANKIFEEDEQDNRLLGNLEILNHDNNKFISGENEISISINFNETLNYYTNYSGFYFTQIKKVKPNFDQLENIVIFEQLYEKNKDENKDNLFFNNMILAFKLAHRLKISITPPKKTANYMDKIELPTAYEVTNLCFEDDDINKCLDLFRDECFDITDSTCSFLDWFPEEKNTSREKRTVFLSEIVDLYCNNNKNHSINFSFFLSRFNELFKNTTRRYDLYLKKFTYTDFLKKLEDHSENIIDQVNKGLNSIQAQVLGLPAISIFILLLRVKNSDAAKASWDDHPIVLSFFIILLLGYLSLILFNICTQKTNLKYLKDKLSRLEENGLITNQLKKDWEEDKTFINKKIKKNKILLDVLAIASVLITLCFIAIILMI